MSTEKEKKLIASLITLFMIPFVFIASASWYGFVISKLWTWFLTPVFNIPPIGLYASVGLAYLIAYVTQSISYYDMDRKSDSHTSDYWKVVFVSFFRGVIFLFSGWIIHLLASR